MRNFARLRAHLMVQRARLYKWRNSISVSIRLPRNLAKLTKTHQAMWRSRETKGLPTTLPAPVAGSCGIVREKTDANDLLRTSRVCKERTCPNIHAVPR